MMIISFVTKKTCMQSYRYSSVNWIWWERTSACYFSIKKSPRFAAHRYYHFHHRVIDCNNSGSRRDFCLCALFVTSLTYERIKRNSPCVRALSFSLSSSCQTFISYIYIYMNWTLLVPSKRKWRRAYIYVYVCILSFDKYCTTIELFLGYYIMDKLCWWTYIYTTSRLSLSKYIDRSHN